MSYGKPIKKNFYATGSGSGEIAMPAEGEMPPVLASNPQDWSGSKSEKVIDNHIEEPVDTEFEEGALEPDESDEGDNDQEQDEVEEVQPKSKGKSHQDNFKALREAKEKAERDRDEMMRYIMEMKKGDMPAQVEQRILKDEPEVDFDLSVDDDALIEGKHAKKLAVELKKIKDEMKRFQNQSSENVIESKIKNQYPDFDKVVTSENINMLNQQYPELASTIRDTKDLYSKAVSAYSIMKKFGIYRDTTYDQEKAVAMKNHAKPRPLASVNPQQGDSPLSKANAFANGMNKDLQAQLLKEMAAARKNL